MTTPTKPNGATTHLIGHVSPVAATNETGASAEAWRTEYHRSLDAHQYNRRRLARALGMSPEEGIDTLIARVADDHKELVRLRQGAEAFRACYEGRPEHVHTRPVCAVTSCDNGPRKDGLCAKHYGSSQKGGE